MQKQCNVCHEVKDISEFTWRKAYNCYYHYCKACSSIKGKARYHLNPEKYKVKVREYNRAHKEIRFLRRLKEKGVPLAWYHETLTRQNNCCAICSKPENGKRLAVDHCHTTNRLRGLLCSNCNTLLGLAHDDIKTLERAIEYLKKPAEPKI